MHRRRRRRAARIEHDERRIVAPVEHDPAPERLDPGERHLVHVVELRLVPREARPTGRRRRRAVDRLRVALALRPRRASIFAVTGEEARTPFTWRAASPLLERLIEEKRQRL